MDLPPSYDHNDQNLSANDSKAQPPDYQPSPHSTSLLTPLTTQDDTSSSSSWHPLPHEPHPTLILDNCIIYSSTHPSRPLYVLSNAPVEALSPAYALEKVYYKSRVSEDGAEEVKRSRTTYIYDFALEVSASIIKSVKIKGQRSSKFTYREVVLSGPGISPSHYKAAVKAPSSNNKSGSGSSSSKGLPSTESFDMRVTPVMADPRSKLSWKSESSSGVLLATESRGTRDASGKMVVQPRLEITPGEGSPDEKEMDVLVVAWCARVWREAAKDTKEPMSWSKFKRIAGTKVGKYDVARAGGFL